MRVDVVSVSGGKDSTAMLALAVERQANIRAVFADTGHEHPLTYEYISYLSDWLNTQGYPPIQIVKADFSDAMARRRVYLLRIAAGEIHDEYGKNRHSVASAARAAAVMRPTGNPFLDMCLLKSRFPSSNARFCSEELKRDPIITQAIDPYLEVGDEVYSWQGVRAEESPSRAKLSEFESIGGGLFNYRPLLRWSVQQVFDYHYKYGLKPNPLYKMGFSRVGCMLCIHSRKDEVLEVANRFPDRIQKIADYEEAVRKTSKIGSATFFQIGGNNRGHGINAVVEWSKTGKGGRNYDLFRTLETDPVCSSVYGLCE